MIEPLTFENMAVWGSRVMCGPAQTLGTLPSALECEGAAERKPRGQMIDSAGPRRRVLPWESSRFLEGPAKPTHEQNPPEPSSATPTNPGHNSLPPAKTNPRPPQQSKTKHHPPPPRPLCSVAYYVTVAQAAFPPRATRGAMFKLWCRACHCVTPPWCLQTTVHHSHGAQQPPCSPVEELGAGTFWRLFGYLGQAH